MENSITYLLFLEKLKQIKNIEEKDNKILITFNPNFTGFNENNFKLFNKLLTEIYKQNKKPQINFLNNKNELITNQSLV